MTDNYNYTDGSWWTLRRGHVSGYFYIVYHVNGHKLYADGNSEIGFTDYVRCADQLWQIVPGDNGETFRLVNYHNAQQLHLRSHANPHIGLFKGMAYADQYFRFFFEAPEVLSVKFDLNLANIMQNAPKLVAQRDFRNDSECAQEENFTVKYTQTRQHSWEYSGGFKISMTMGVEFQAGIPCFGSANTSLSLGLETSHTWTTGTVRTESQEMSYAFPLKVPPHRRLMAKVLIHEERAEVPYTMVVRFKGSKTTTTSNGTWKGMQCVRVSNQITQM